MASNDIAQEGVLTLVYEKDGKQYVMVGKVKDIAVATAPVDKRYCYECGHTTVDELVDRGCNLFIPHRVFLEFEEQENGKFANIRRV